MRAKKEIVEDMGLYQVNDDYSWEMFNLEGLKLEVLCDCRDQLTKIASELKQMNRQGLPVTTAEVKGA